MEPVYQVKLLAALRTGDPALIHPFLAEIGKDRRSSLSSSGLDSAAAALHLAVRCASAQTVALFLSNRAISVNGIHPPGSGTTPLHLAASLGRADIVNLLLEQDGIDDTLHDDRGKTCRDVAKSRDVLKAIDDSRSLLNASYRSLLHSYILSPINDPPSPALLDILNSPRASLLNISYLDDESGSSILHEAAHRKDLRLIELAVRAGADVFLRNRRGKTAYESVKDDKVRVFLRQFANHDQSLIPSSLPASEPPALRGYLNKYANVARGYSTRWFVLAHGVLSYYRRQEDESITTRGSISMKNALVKVNEQNRTRFEIHSLLNTPIASTLTSSSIQKWYIKANHPVEAARWIQALNKSIEWARASSQVPKTSFESDTKYTALKRPLSVNRKRTATTGPEDTDSINAALGADPNLSDFNGEQPQLSAGEDDDEFDVAPGTTGNGMSADDSSSADTGSRHRLPPYEDVFELQGNSILAQLEITQNLLISYFGGSGASAAPQISSSQSIASAKSSSTGSCKSPGTLSNKSLPAPSYLPVPQSSIPSSSPNPSEIKSTVLESMSTLFTLTQEYTSMSREREQSYKKALAQEKARQTVWEESLATVVREGANLEQELRNRSRKRGSRVFGPGEGYVATFAKGAGFGSAGGAVGELGVLGEEGDGMRTRNIAARRSRPNSRYSTIKSTTVRTTEKDQENALGVTLVSSPQPIATSPPPSAEGARPRIPTSETIKLKDEESFYSDEDEEEDEFFDAIDSNNLPNLVVPPSLAIPSPMTSPQKDVSSALPPSANKMPTTPTNAIAKVKLSAATLIQPPPASPAVLPPFIDIAPYKGYEKLRTKLGLTSDNRPPTSLWSVLKHSIGKDLTRISFPVFFNEPTSMLQRMAEDMEFSECLDTAATERDSLKRLAYVAAFAMSNYSSTIGRIAKPFNPMLSETFEYVRLDKKYRYVSEQVSHHPPISACWAESPLWHYFGEVDAQNKFMGKSFEIRPTGVAHAELIIPESWIVGHGSAKPKGYRKAKGVICGEGKVIEHYTWKKVTTNVSGFILGSPTIDHYGDMVVVNHRTNEKCILTFKPRGWRGKDAYEISGQVLDARGRVVYEIAGRWNSQLIMRGVGGGGVLHPDTAVSSTSELSSSDDLDDARTSTVRTNSISSQQVGNNAPEYILLWKNSPKPVGSPFNLTPFAITLNDCSGDELKPFLCPTDCRLRPDQRAFEMGIYDLANELKSRQEEKQRFTRREREMGVRGEHRPRWFEARTDGDTGERVWMPKRVRVEVCVGGGEDVREEDEIEYWAERERVWKEGGKKKWVDVEDIFIEEPEAIRT